jgi:hypothetical protein
VLPCWCEFAFDVVDEFEVEFELAAASTATTSG